jgi:hypothetical protein
MIRAGVMECWSAGVLDFSITLDKNALDKEKDSWLTVL